MAKIVVSVGFRFPGGIVEYVPTNSDRSLLDADIILFRADISDFPSEQTHLGEFRTYQGDRRLSEEGSFALKRAARHWNSQLKIAYETNKTILVLLPPYEQVRVDSGQRAYSGTGRNRQTTVLLSEINSYEFLPIKMTATASVGTGIKPATDLGFLAPLWGFLKEHLKYQVMLEDTSFRPLLLTRTGNKIVGGLLAGKGAMILWPDIDLPRETFVTEGGAWSKFAKQFGHQLLDLIIETDKAAHAEGNVTPTPTWATASEFRLQEENQIQGSILSLDGKIETLIAQRQVEQEQLIKAGSLRALLFEKGPRLESAVRDALTTLGFQADKFKDGEHEFDAVFEAPEGRFIGEVEGRDQKGIAIEKLSQLERNIQEDYARDEITTYAKGVLFGNAERLTPIEQRGDFFTVKVLSGAQRSRISLVRTPDLFEVAKSLRNFPDADFAKKCREAIALGEGGIVVFPKPERPSDDVGLLQTDKSMP
jgi:hypothetical protein